MKILKELKDNYNNIKDGKVFIDEILCCEELIELLDYIKELEAYKSNMDYEYLKLQRELEKLKEELESVTK